MKIKKGDKVLVIAGKSKGKTSQVSKVVKSKNMVMVDDVNIFIKHVKGQGKVALQKPISSSNVKVICQSCSKPSRIGFKIENNKKVRYCRNCNAII